MGSERQIRTTIEAISAATVGEADWGDVTGALVSLVGAGTNALWVGDPYLGQVEVLGSSFDASVERGYAEHYHRLDLWTQRGVARRSGAPVLGTELVPEGELLRSEIYADFFRPLGMSHVIAAMVPLGGTAGFGVLGLHRPEKSRTFDEIDRLALAEVLPSLRRALRTRHELKQVTGTAHAAMSGLASMGAPALAVDVGGRILFANAPAAALLKMKRGLVSRAGRCVAAHPADEAAVAALLAGVTSGGVGGLLRLRTTSGAPPLTLMANRPLDGGGPAVALVFLLDPMARRAQAKALLLRTLHGLTAAEAEVAEFALAGEAAASIAARRGTSEATVRVQLRLVLEKTGAENLRLLATRVAALPEMVD